MARPCASPHSTTNGRNASSSCRSWPPPALTQQGAIQDDMKDGLNLRGRMTSVVTPFATGGFVPPSKPKDRVAPKQYTVGESKPAGNLQANIADQPTNPPVPADESGLNEDSKGLLLVVAFGAALAAVETVVGRHDAGEIGQMIERRRREPTRRFRRQQHERTRRQRHDIRFQTIDHRPALFAGTTVRLPDIQLVATAFGLPIGDESAIEVLI